MNHFEIGHCKAVYDWVSVIQYPNTCSFTSVHFLSPVGTLVVVHHVFSKENILFFLLLNSIMYQVLTVGKRSYLWAQTFEFVLVHIFIVMYSYAAHWTLTLVLHDNKDGNANVLNEVTDCDPLLKIWAISDMLLGLSRNTRLPNTCTVQGVPPFLDPVNCFIIFLTLLVLKCHKLLIWFSPSLLQL